MQQLSSLIDEIYEAAFRPEIWPLLLHKISRLIDAEGAVLANLSSPGLPWFASNGVHDLYERFFEDGWAYDNAKTRALLSIPHQGFICDADHLTDEWMSRQPIYRDFFWPRGFGYAAGTVIEGPGALSVAISVEFKKSQEPASPLDLNILDTLRPHLGRSVSLATRFEHKKIEAALQALELANVPASILGSDGKVLSANQAFLGFSETISIGAFNRLSIRNFGAQTFYNSLANSHAHSNIGRSFPLPANTNSSPAVIHFIPVKRSVREIFSLGAYFLLITAARRGAEPSAEILKGMFDFTPTEARIAAKLGSGLVISQIAKVEGLAVETIRSHVKSILGKAGMKRQGELVAQLASMQMINDRTL